jgi:TusA-related sulfurtransferase
MSRALLFLLSLLAACGERQTPNSSDSAFARVQSRGHVAMGVDQYTSAHRFEPLSDGGRITLERNESDSTGTAQIRSHMQTIARAFQQGNFALPGFVHDREVPGTVVMTKRRSRISYTTDTLPRGAQLRIHSTDTAAVNAIHQFLAFQRQDHRVGESGAAH